MAQSGDTGLFGRWMHGAVLMPGARFHAPNVNNGKRATHSRHTYELAVQSRDGQNARILRQCDPHETVPASMRVPLNDLRRSNESHVGVDSCQLPAVPQHPARIAAKREVLQRRLSSANASLSAAARCAFASSARPRFACISPSARFARQLLSSARLASR